jgi:hypothetical protein
MKPRSFEPRLKSCLLVCSRDFYEIVLISKAQEENRELMNLVQECEYPSVTLIHRYLKHS